ncbi:GumC family protein [Desulfogranum japonicum]|uniref:GumC family protein n=1 Tax=Desulfogranum japonicum TaxID=231447 RepID=UPI00129468CC|nr:hypothetical protein [Desulfogranum japonicum]
MNESRVYSVRDLLISMFARISLIRRVFIVMVVLTTGIALFLPKVYTVTGNVIILATEIHQGEGPSLAKGSITQYLPVTLKDIETEATILRSVPLIQKALGALHSEGSLNIEYSWMDKWVKQPFKNYVVGPVRSLFGQAASNEDETAALTKVVLDSLEIVPVPGSNVIGIHYETDDINQGQLIVNRLMDEYLAMRDRLITGPTQRLFSQKKDLYKERFEQLSNEKIELFDQHEIHTPKEELSLVLQTINKETNEYNQLADRLLELKKWQQYLEQNIAEMNSANSSDFTILSGLEVGVGNYEDQIPGYKEIQLQLERIRTLQAEYDEAVLSFNQDSLPVVQAKEKIALSKKRLVGLLEGSNRDQLQKMQVLQSVSDQKEKRLADLRQRASLLTEVAVQETGIDTELAVVNEAYYKYSQQYEEKHLDELLHRDTLKNVKVLSYAPVPLEPSSPKKKIVLLVGMISSALFAISIGFICDIFDKRMYDPVRVNSTFGLPVIAIIDDRSPDKEKIPFSAHPARFFKWLLQ